MGRRAPVRRVDRQARDGAGRRADAGDGAAIATARVLAAGQRRRSGAAGLRFALPVGELPLYRSGTFTIWDDAQAIARFVGCDAHRTAMAARREQSWYREELFARFAVERSEEGDA